MARYEFICNECEVIWEKEYPMSKAPEKAKCPECNKSREQNYAGRDTSIAFRGPDFWTARNQNKKLILTDKTVHKRVKEELLQSTKDRLSNETKPYRDYNLGKDFVKTLEKEGKIRSKTDYEKSKGREAAEIREKMARRLKKEHYDIKND